MDGNGRGWEWKGMGGNGREWAEMGGNGNGREWTGMGDYRSLSSIIVGTLLEPWTLRKCVPFSMIPRRKELDPPGALADHRRLIRAGKNQVSLNN